jgi:perosamine synthetase
VASSTLTEFIPFARADIGEDEIEAVTRVLRSGWITTGPETRAFEHEFAQYVGAPHAVAMNSCTAALHLGLEALGIGPGDEVATTTMTFTATAEVVEYLGARTRFFDIEASTLCLDIDRFRDEVIRQYQWKDGAWRHKAGGGALRALVPVHYAGSAMDMTAILAMAEELGIVVLDDAAHSLPSEIDGRRVGSFPCTTAFSFYATKTLTTGEGGMLTTHDEAIAHRARLMSLHGISRDAWKRYTAEGSWYYEVEASGFKYNLTDIASALGRVQLRRVEGMRDRRAQIAARYSESFGSLPEVQCPTSSDRVLHSWHLYPIRLDLARLRVDRAQFIEELKRRNVGASVHFIPLHQQPFYKNKYGYRPESFPVAEAEYPRLASLPIFSAMESREVEAVIEAVHDIVATSRR